MSPQSLGGAGPGARAVAPLGGAGAVGWAPPGAERRKPEVAPSARMLEQVKETAAQMEHRVSVQGFGEASFVRGALRPLDEPAFEAAGTPSKIEAECENARWLVANAEARGQRTKRVDTLLGTEVSYRGLCPGDRVHVVGRARPSADGCSVVLSPVGYWDNTLLISGVGKEELAAERRATATSAAWAVNVCFGLAAGCVAAAAASAYRGRDDGRGANL